VIGDEVELRIEAEATRGRCDGGDADADTAPVDSAPPSQNKPATDPAEAASSPPDRAGEAERPETPAPSHAPETTR